MRLYETMLLVDARLDTTEAEAVVDRFAALVAERGGTVENVDKWGRRRLAYEIKDLQEGYYAIMTYGLEPDRCKELDEALPFVDGLVRWKTVYPQSRTRRVRT